MADPFARSARISRIMADDELKSRGQSEAHEKVVAWRASAGRWSRRRAYYYRGL
jgi:hypothetical protein